jgi:hypothetical protein
MYGVEVNLDEDQEEKSNMRSSESHDGPHKSFLLSNSVPSSIRLGVNRGRRTFPALVL